MPVYKTKDPLKHRVVIFHKGKRNDWIVEGKRAEAESFEARERVKLDRGSGLSTRTAPLFSAFCVEAYKPFAELHLKKGTWERSRKYQLATLMQHFGKLKLNQITSDEIDAYKSKRAKIVRPISVNNEVAVLQAVLTFARDEKKLPVADVKIRMLPVYGERRVTAWTPSQVQALFRATKATHPDLLTLIAFIANTGVRKGEAIVAEVSWVNLKTRMLVIPATEAWSPKSGRSRDVPIGDALLPLLTEATRHKQWLFESNTGRRWAVFPQRRFKECVRAAGLRGGPHTLRHSYASQFLQVVPDLFLLSKVLGHSETRTTKLYAHLLPDHLARARNAVNLAPDLAQDVRQHAKEK